MSDLWQCLYADQQALLDRAPKTPVNDLRREIYQACVAAAQGAQGIYRLTVPTGGGKTRSALAFALRHAVTHHLDRVLVAVPYISITEQTAQVYRDIFAALSQNTPIVLEHHSAAVERSDDPEPSMPSRFRLTRPGWSCAIGWTRPSATSNRG